MVEAIEIGPKLVWRDLLNSSFIFLLNVNFENLIVGLHVYIISSMLTKFQEDQNQ